MRLPSWLPAFLVLFIASPVQAQSQWIWTTEDETPAETRYFRKIFAIDSKISKATLSITADDAFVAWINGKSAGVGAGWQSLKTFDVTPLVKSGKNVLAVAATNTGGVAALVATLEVEVSEQKQPILVTDKSWKANVAPTKGWEQLDFIETGWGSVKVLGPFGKTAPWTQTAASANPKERFRVPDGFVVEKVVPADATYDKIPPGRHVSFVNMCFDATGRILLSQEGGPILACNKADEKGLYSNLHVYCDLVRNCQGMCWVHDSLFLVGDGPGGTGLYRCRDTKNADKIDEVKLLHRFNGGMGEHGPHAVIHGPDGFLYVVVGNHAFAQLGPKLPKGVPNPAKLAANSPLLRWPTGGMGPDQGLPGSTEDVLLPRLNDSNGHAANILAPGGTIWRVDLDGKNMSLVSAGYRNQYDAAFNPHGELFSFDSDMEWDVGLPWYRPVRIVHAPMGSDFGWRTGAANQPSYLFDFLPPFHDTGRGSPVGVECYDHNVFPAKYQGAVFCADWAIGTIFAAFPKAAGGAYGGTIEKFVTGQPMNITDLAVGPEGALYFSLGGRNGQGEVFRLRFSRTAPLVKNTGDAAYLLTAPQPLAPYRRAEFTAIAAKTPGLAADLEKTARNATHSTHERIRAIDLLSQYTAAGASAAMLVELTKDGDALVRAHAMLYLGIRGGDASRDAILAGLTDPSLFVRRRACEALVRAGIEPPIDVLWHVLGSPDRFVRFAARSVLERIEPAKWVGRLVKEDDSRVGMDAIVALCRANRAEASAEIIFDWLTKVPHPNADADMLDLVRTWQLALFHTKTRPEEIKKTAEDWSNRFPHPDLRISHELAVLLTGFVREGVLKDHVNVKLIFEMQKKNVSRESQIHYFYCLRFMPHGLSEEQKRVLLLWFDATKSWTGGNSFTGFLVNIFKDCLKGFGPADREFVLQHAAEAPWSALVMMQSTPAKVLPAADKLHEVYSRLAKSTGTAKVKELREQIITALGQSNDPESAKAIRAIADDDPSKSEVVARALARDPSKDNWPYLVRGLNAKSPLVVLDVIRALKKSPEKPTLSQPPKAGEATPFRALILAAGRLPEKDRTAAADLLRAWGGKSFALDGGDWKKELEGWSQWFTQTFPAESALPNTTLLSATSKWNAKDLLTYLETDPRGKAGDVAKGRLLFEKATCVKCHKFGNVGEGLGPDLTTLRSRFKTADLVDSLLTPSKVISDQYRGTTFVTKAGKLVTGLAAPQGDTITVLQLDGSKVVLQKSEIEQHAASTVSVMPERLIEELTREEIADLVAFLLSDPKQ